ncbi:peptide N-acetyl-beta-D-glucosaminyl asparaginase amidase A-domain-containing protein [Microdochium bolleyi]|uniref:Peptide N-acetyl-beta-D-glucosaminyl asparaginase amidase A-domain-containing protein n=1 Tax=Microdochium bolleyi TaxID=196109 RepID=A0A136IW50_9PEZI|nr:peptide N-acetyl-beta-D-glucosaminyl asparaginase amidase A-domain-containing protein [Microdochium bolleyi]
MHRLTLLTALAAIAAAAAGPPTPDVVVQSSLPTPLSGHAPSSSELNHDSRVPDVAAATGPAQLFQVAPPIQVPTGKKVCTAVLMEHSFNNTRGRPFIAQYKPPKCKFDRVVIHFNVSVRGQQNDRTGVMYLDNTEVWRTMTPQTTPDGAQWHWDKDMTHYLSLWRQPRTLRFDLVDGTIAGPSIDAINTTLTATFFRGDRGKAISAPADLIIPISNRPGYDGEPMHFIWPEQNATNTISFPRNANRAVFSLSAQARDQEKFWWSNLANLTMARYFGRPAHVAWREIQILIDGELAGVSWPYPTVFAGDVVSQLHRPVVGINTFDIREHEIDITPWLPQLCNGRNHTFTIQDPNSSFQAIEKVTAHTFLNVTSAKVITEKSAGPATWSQELWAKNTVSFYEYGLLNINTVNITGIDSTRTGAGMQYTAKYHYPLFYKSTSTIAEPEEDVTSETEVFQGLKLDIKGSAVFPLGMESYQPKDKTRSFRGARLDTSWESIAIVHRVKDNSTTDVGASQVQAFNLWGVVDGPSSGSSAIERLYHRFVKSVNSTIVSDE